MKKNQGFFDEIPVSPITDCEYDVLRKMLLELIGIELGPNKQVLVTSRLRQRLLFHCFCNFSDYIDLLKDDKNVEEKQVLVDLLTTNETYFFREDAHFRYLREEILPRFESKQQFRFWSAACSSGEEAYSAAMILDGALDTGKWEVFASDVNQQVLSRARRGLYQMQRLELMPKNYLHKYCLKGSGPYESAMLIKPELKEKVSFSHINLMDSLPEVGLFDVIFLRNILIYFAQKERTKIIQSIFNVLRPGGFLFTGHSESIKGIHPRLNFITASIYQRINE